MRRPPLYKNKSTVSTLQLRSGLILSEAEWINPSTPFRIDPERSRMDQLLPSLDDSLLNAFRDRLVMRELHRERSATLAH